MCWGDPEEIIPKYLSKVKENMKCEFMDKWCVNIMTQFEYPTEDPASQIQDVLNAKTDEEWIEFLDQYLDSCPMIFFGYCAQPTQTTKVLKGKIAENEWPQIHFKGSFE